MIRLALVVFAVPLALAVVPAHGQVGQPSSGLAIAKLTIGGHGLTAELAITPEHVQTGLMHRFSLPPDHGMLFVFPFPRPLSFWMRNTYVPLSIAFIDAQGRIVNIEDMTPRDERLTWSAGPALYALEMRRGWFSQKGIVAGAEVKGLPPKAAN